MKKLVLALAIVGTICGNASAAFTIFDDFNVDEGRFGLDPNFSGSSVEDALSSTADRVTTDGPLEGAGHQKLVFDYEDNSASTAIRIRHLSGGGAAGGASGQPANTAFTTSGVVDGWIGFYLKTTVPDWNVQLFIEGASNNGSIPKTVIADGLWHVYQWNLDDNSGGADGWGTVAGIIAGVATVADGSHTIDSIVFRDGTTASSTIYLDLVQRNSEGMLPEPTVAPVPAPGSFATMGFGSFFAIAFIWLGNRRSMSAFGL